MHRIDSMAIFIHEFHLMCRVLESVVRADTQTQKTNRSPCRLIDVIIYIFMIFGLGPWIRRNEETKKRRFIQMLQLRDVPRAVSIRYSSMTAYKFHRKMLNMNLIWIINWCSYRLNGAVTCMQQPRYYSWLRDATPSKMTLFGRMRSVDRMHFRGRDKS